MNFLVIYSEDNTSKKDLLERFLKSVNVSVESYKLENNYTANFENIPAKVEQISHCVVIDKDSLKKNFAFALGYILGKGIYVYTLKEEWTKAGQKCKNLKDFNSFEELISYLVKNIESIKGEFIKNRAWKKLFDGGNPYTPDSLATHIEKDNREIVQTYIDAGMSLNERTSLGTPMLNVAIRAEQVDEVKWLLEHDIDLNAVSKDRGYSALMDCVWKKNFELAKILVDRGVNLDFVSTDNQSALVLAVGQGNEKMVQLLAEAGANPDNKDALGMSAYGYAKLFKRDDLLKILEPYHHEN